MRLANLRASGGWEGPETSAVVAAGTTQRDPTQRDLAQSNPSPFILLLVTWPTGIWLQTPDCLEKISRRLFWFNHPSTVPKSFAYADGAARGCTCWGWSARNRIGLQLSWRCVWPSLHERVVTAAGTGVVFRLTGHKYSITDVLRDNGFPMPSVVADETIPVTISLSLPI